jgi:uncharacterized protein
VKKNRLSLFLVALFLLLTACNSATPTAQPTAAPTPAPTTGQTTAPAPTVTAPARVAPINTAVPAVATSAPSPSPQPPTPTAVPVATVPVATVPANLPPRYIEALRNRKFDGGEIKVDKLYEQNAAYTAHLIYYQSDGLQISGLMMTPTGDKTKKYPVALVNHGYFNPPEYNSGWDTIRELRYFAQRGYITIASDYRNYARSDKGDNDREPGYTIDILNLVEAVKKLPQADPTKITIMGHSMGGEIALNAMVVNKDIKAFALFGTMSADATDNFYARLRWRGGDTAEKRIYGDPAQNPEQFKKMSPLTYFSDITAPVIIHVGTNDTTTPPLWSEKIFNNLKTLGKTTEYYTYTGQGHSLNGAAFDQSMTRTLSFFNKAIGK